MGEKVLIRKFKFLVLFLFFITIFSLDVSYGIGTAPYAILNAPANASNFDLDIFNILLNATVFDDDNDLIDVLIYGVNSTDTSNFYNYLLFKELGVSNGSQVTHNFTSLPIDPNLGSLVGLWHFDNLSEFGENQSFIYDFALGHNNGTRFGNLDNAYNTTEGGFKFGYASNFNGSTGDYISVDDSDSLDISGNLTITVWINLNSLPRNSMRILTKSQVNSTSINRNLSTDDVTFYGIGSQDSSGSGVGSGDFNNDGIDDVIIGAHLAEGVDGTTDAGEAYIIYGPLNNSAEINLSTANITFYGIDSNDHSGIGIGSGDFNNDGIDDVIIGANTAERAGESIDNDRGESYVFYGPFNASAVINLSTANITFYGIDFDDESGTGVGSGDFNNDGIDDVIIGAHNAEGAGSSPNLVGETYIIYGPLNDSAEISLSTANITFYGIDAGDRSGISVSSGDFNDDGIDDVLIGAYLARGPDNSIIGAGEAYIIYGPLNDSGVFNLSTANITFYGIDAHDQSGRSGGSGDFNNDGVDDVIIGAHIAERAGEQSNINRGETYVLYGPFNASAVISLSTANITFYGIDNEDASGTAVGSGDFNNDGIDDAIIGAKSAELDSGGLANIGETYITYGPLQLIENYNLMINKKGKPVASFIDSSQKGIAVQGSSITLNEFTFIAATINDTEMSIYTNTETTTKTISSTLIVNNFDLTIGSFTNGLSSNFDGSIDEVAIWNRTLSSTEIKNIYRLKAGKYFWKVNVTDSAGNNNESETREFRVTDDPSKFIIQNASGTRAAWLGSEGNIMLKGTCKVST